MTITSTKLIAEFQHFFNKAATKLSLNKYNIPIPSDIPEIFFIVNKSFIRLLFDNTWNHSEYLYLWLENPSRISWPSLIRQRLCIYPYSAKYYELTSDSTSGENFFYLTSEDLNLLDALLSYRLDPENTLINENNVDEVLFDPNTSTLHATFSIISSKLSKLIFLFLKIKISNSYEDYNDETTISNNNSPLEMAYEIYVIDEIFKYLISKEGLPS